MTESVDSLIICSSCLIFSASLSLVHCSGAGQEVGRSCIMLEFKNKKIMVSESYEW